MARLRRLKLPLIAAALEATAGKVSLAAAKLGCDTSHLYARIRRSPKLKAVVNEAREAVVDAAEIALRAAVVAREPWAVKFVLKTLGKERGYVERLETKDVTEKPLRVVVVDDPYWGNAPENSDEAATAAPADGPGGERD